MVFFISEGPGPPRSPHKYIPDMYTIKHDLRCIIRCILNHTIKLLKLMISRNVMVQLLFIVPSVLVNGAPNAEECEKSPCNDGHLFGIYEL
jgi:hypothetical protein